MGLVYCLKGKFKIYIVKLIFITVGSNYNNFFSQISYIRHDFLVNYLVNYE